MLTETKRTDLFCEYYAKWITVYKKGAIRKVTMDKYLMTQKWLVKLVPNLRVCSATPRTPTGIQCSMLWQTRGCESVRSPGFGGATLT